MASTVQIYVPPETHKTWKMRAVYEDITLSELVRRAMRTYMETLEGGDAAKSCK